MATKIPPHNLTEIVDATIAVVRDPEVDINVCSRSSKAGLSYRRLYLRPRRDRNSYLTGRGILQMRAKASIDRIGRGSHERDAGDSFPRFHFRLIKRV